MSRVLITGASGFLGRNFIELLLSHHDHTIVALSRTPEDIGIFHPRVQVVSHDLQHPFGDDLIAQVGGVDYIIHFAAATNAQESSRNPLSFVMNNMVGTAHLLEFARASHQNLKQFLFFSTAEVFGPAPTGTVFNEESRLNPLSPYAATKIGAQELCMAYKNTFGLPTIIAYAMNSFGPYQSSEKFVPLVVEKILKGEEVSIHLNPEGTAPNRRNYLHVKDMCDAIYFLMKRGQPGEKYNIASAQETDNLHLAQLIARLLDKKLHYALDSESPRPLALPRLSGEKLYHLGWREKRTLEEGMHEYLEGLRGEDRGE